MLPIWHGCELAMTKFKRLLLSSKVCSKTSAISSIDTAGIKPTSHPIEINNVFRKDVPKPSLTQKQVLSNAPKMEDSRFAVPQILGDSE